MKRVITLSLLTMFLVACNDTDDDFKISASALENVQFNALVYNGEMDNTYAQISYAGEQIEVPVNDAGHFEFSIPLSELRNSSFDLQALGYIDETLVVLNSRFEWSEEAELIAMQDKSLSYTDFDALFVSPVSEAYFQLPINAEQEWLVNYAGAVKLLLDRSLDVEQAVLYNLASDETAAREFADSHTEGGYHSKMAQAISSLQTNSLFGMNLIDQRLIGDFYTAKQVPARFARRDLLNEFSIHPEQLAVPNIVFDENGLPSHDHHFVNWSRVNNRIFIEPTDHGLGKRLFTRLVPETDEQLYNAYIDKFGKSVYDTTAIRRVNEITLVSVQPNALLVRYQDQFDLEPFEFEWEGQQYTIGSESILAGVETKKLLKMDEEKSNSEKFEQINDETWVLPLPGGTMANLIVQLNNDNTFTTIDIVDAEVSEFVAENNFGQLFAQGTWSLEQEDRSLRLSSVDNQGQMWHYRAYLTKNNDIGREVTAEIYRDDEALSYGFGGYADRLVSPNSVDFQTIIAEFEDPFLVSLVNHGTERWDGSEMKVHQYFGWWLYDDGNGMVPRVTCEGFNVINGVCNFDSPTFEPGELISWLSSNNTIMIQRYQDQMYCDGFDSIDYLCDAERIIVPLSVNENNEIRGIEWQTYGTNDGLRLFMAPRLMDWKLIEAPEFFEKVEDPEVDPIPEPDPVDVPVRDPAERYAHYDGVSHFNYYLDLGAEFSGAEVQLKLGEQVLTTNLDDAGWTSAIVTMESEAIPLGQVLDVTVEVPGKPLELRQITDNYEILESMDVGGKYISFDLQPSAWTTAHAAWVDKLLENKKLTSHTLLSANLAMESRFLEDTALFIHYWLSIPGDSWNISYNGLDELLESYSVFYDRFEYYSYELNSVREIIASDSRLMSQLDSEGYFAGTFDLVEPLPLWSFAARNIGSLDYALPGLSINYRRVGTAPEEAYQELQVASDEFMAALVPFADPTYYQRAWSFPIWEFADSSDIFDFEDIVNAWEEKNDGNSPNISLVRYDQLSSLNVKGYFNRAISIQKNYRQVSDVFEFEHDGILYFDLQSVEPRQQSYLQVDLSHYVEPGAKIELSFSEPMLVGPLAEGFSGNLFAQFKENGRLEAYVGDVTYQGTWWLTYDDRVLKVQLDGFSDFVIIQPLLDDKDVMLYTRFDSNADAVLKRLSPLMTVSENALSPFSRDELYDALQSGLLLADMELISTEAFWGKDRLPSSIGKAWGIHNNYVTQYLATCDDFILDRGSICGDRSYSNGDYDITVSEPGDDELRKTDSGVSFTYTDRWGDTLNYELVPLGVIDDVVVFVLKYSYAYENSNVESVLLYYGRFIDPVNPLGVVVP